MTDKKEVEPGIKVVEITDASRKLNFKVFEILPGSKEADEFDASLDRAKMAATDLADAYEGSLGRFIKEPVSTGYTVIPVLEFLNGKPWDNMALNYVHGLRPSALRVTTGEITCDSHIYRVTVYVGEDKRTIKRIEQEVRVGLHGARCGSDLWNYMRGEPIPDKLPSGIINMGALKKRSFFTEDK